MWEYKTETFSSLFDTKIHRKKNATPFLKNTRRTVENS
jgi:hypothetical protein